MVSSKNEIRRRLERCRDAISVSQREALSSRICAKLLEFLGLRYHRVALYAPIGSEVDTGPLFCGLEARGVETVYPRCETGSRELTFVKVDAVESLRPGTFGVPEPHGEGVPRESIGLVVVPGIGFDHRGQRLGYGGGYYDATLAGYSGSTAGLAFAVQWVDELPSAAHDRCVDVVVTEDGVHPATGARGGATCPSSL